MRFSGVGGRDMRHTVPPISTQPHLGSASLAQYRFTRLQELTRISEVSLLENFPYLALLCTYLALGMLKIIRFR
jgi:hypothetical protein